MGIWSRLFGKVQATSDSRAAAFDVVRMPGPGLFSLEAVGESKYQVALEQICGGRNFDGADVLTEATLVYEDSNPYDSQAIRVDISGQTVGYLSRDHARQFRRQMAQLGNAGCPVICAARIRGGWDRGDGDRGNYGVRLDIVTLGP